MPMDENFIFIWHVLVSGVVTGCFYALIGMSMVLIYKTSKVINLCQGELTMLGGYVCFSIISFTGIHFLIAFSITLFAVFLIGILVERTILRPLLGESPIAILMVTIGMANILGGVVGLIWGADSKAFPLILSPSSIVLVIIVVSVSLVLIFLGFFKFSIIGISMRSVASDQQASLALGVSIKKTLIIAWGLSAVLSAAAGIFMGNLSGLNLSVKIYGLKALAPMILGGLDSVAGAVLGGFIVGVTEVLGDTYISDIIGGSISDSIAFFIIIVVLIIKPYGIFGTEEIERI